jgi:hypothetical protein
MTSDATLRAVKILHTLIWAWFAGCIIALPAFGWAGRFDWALMLAGVVTIEVLVIAFNRGSCPLTGVAARYTDDRQDNFDIYLPVWLARHNKAIFGTLFVAGLVLTLGRWLSRS